MAKRAIKLVDQTSVAEAGSGGDTIRLWENYREQATMWRAIALLQMPATVVSVGLATLMWLTRVSYLNVPARPLPGQYAVSELPDTEFENVATDFVNLVGSYTATTARQQFTEASELLAEPYLSTYKNEMLATVLPAIEQVGRTQIFMVDPTKTTFERRDKYMTVTYVGERTRFLAGKEIPAKKGQFKITMVTNPRNKLNPYGIVIVNVEFSEID